MHTIELAQARDSYIRLPRLRLPGNINAHSLIVHIHTHIPIHIHTHTYSLIVYAVHFTYCHYTNTYLPCVYLYYTPTYIERLLHRYPSNRAPQAQALHRQSS